MVKTDLLKIDKAFALVSPRYLKPERARILRGWTHSGFNIHRSHRLLPRNHATHLEIMED
jgi:hypothetical protein